jgi:hypothetical protein
MIPNDHPVYQFPYNLEDRIKHYIKLVNKIVGRSIDILTKKQKDENNNPIYELTFKNDKYIKDYVDELKNIGFILKEDIWICLLK